MAFDFFVWSSTHFGTMDPASHLRRIILGSTLICLGIQSFSTSFYLALIRSFDL